MLTLVLVLGVAAAALYMRSVGDVQPQTKNINLPPPEAVNLPWPSIGQAAVGAVGYGVLEQTPSQTPVPMASVAKIMTALAVLDRKPLAASQPGPNIPISEDDVAVYRQSQSQGQSVVAVQAGEQISEYQALQALLIPSANNFAELLANWAFGSVDEYLTYANQKVASLGLKNTHFTDPSGFSPQTVSTASDLIILGLAALKNPVISSVVSQSQVALPVAGVQKNVNWLLGSEGIIGIKTGNSDQAGGCFLLAANRTVSGQPVTILTAAMAAPDLTAAMTDAKNLLMASDSGFAKLKILNNGEPVARYDAKWGASANAVAQTDISVLAWRGQPAKVSITLKELPPGSPKGTKAGAIVVQNREFYQTTPFFLNQELKKPTIWWRIFR